MEKRSGLIIGCPGGIRNEHLRGVSNDMETCDYFLPSPRSGCFYRWEYDVIDNPTRSELQKIIQSTITEYQVIFFAGHGYTDSNTGRRMICLKDGDVPDTFLFNSSRIQLIIIDACRTLIPGIAGITEYVEPYAGFDGVSIARTTFDNYISNSNSGKLILHGTKENTSAWELAGGSGGLFTQSLLRTASTIEIDGNLKPLYVHDLLPIVKRDMVRSGYSNQIPDIVYQTIGYNMPFIINAPQITAKRKINSIDIKRQPSNITNSILACLGISLVVVGIASFFD